MKGKSHMTPAVLKALGEGDIVNVTVAATPSGIEAQERQGQDALVANSGMLPKELYPDQAAFETLGFVFGENVDELFVSVTLPEGWVFKATDHAMHSDILDALGRWRVGVFYKAAFYDRRATARLKARYDVQYQKTPAGAVEFYFSDGDSVMEVFATQADGQQFYELLDIAKEALLKRWPDAKNPLAYWDD